MNLINHTTIDGGFYLFDFLEKTLLTALLKTKENKSFLFGFYSSAST